MKKVDVAIVGGGTAGLAAERVARDAGASTALMDGEFAGTTCATVGCMPSKLLIAAAGAAHSVRRASTFGIFATRRIDGAAVMARVRRERDAFVEATRGQIAQLPDGVALRGTAQFVDATTLVLADGQQVQARAIVIATGAHPAIPEVFAPIRARVLTNETLFELAQLPESLAVVGAGPVGLELAQAMARLGVPVTLFDSKVALAGVDDPAFVPVMHHLLKQELDLHLGVQIQAGLLNDKVRIEWQGASHGVRDFDRVLLAVGRPPNLAALNLAATGLTLNERGIPLFDGETLQCGTSPIFIAGDVSGDRPVLHEAQLAGATAGFNAARFPHEMRRRCAVPFSITFTDPPLALLGRRSGAGLICGTTDFREQGRARVEARAQGLLRIHASAEQGVLQGAALLCPGADHLGQLLAWPIAAGITAAGLLEQPFYHPTLAEGLKPALRQICAQIAARLPPAAECGAPSGA